MSSVMPAESTAPRLRDLFLASFSKLASVQPGERVLDLCAGDGEAIVEAGRRSGAEGEQLLLDPDAARLDQAVRRARAEGLSDARGEVCDASTLPSADGYWDVVLCHLSLPNLPDVDASLREATRVLRPVGRFIVSVWGERARCPLLTIFLDAVAPYAPAAAALDKALFRYSAAGALATTLASAGFEDAVPERLTEWPAFTDVEQYWSVLSTDRHLAPLVAVLTPAQIAAVKATIETKTRFYRRPTGLELKVEGVVLAAVK